jgi:hypothetical protein
MSRKRTKMSLATKCKKNFKYSRYWIQVGLDDGFVRKEIDDVK